MERDILQNIDVECGMKGGDEAVVLQFGPLPSPPRERLRLIEADLFSRDFSP
jgi:hypothetical protein